MTTRQALIATIAYSDVFDYPLTEEEVKKWIINSKSKKQKAKSKNLEEYDGYFFLKGRKKIVALRQQREKWANEKIRIAQKAAKILKLIPTIRLIGITGALAMKNAHRDDDIDFYIVTSVGTLWTTRFLATLILQIFGLRRKPGDTAFRNKICLNMYVDEKNLAVAKNERDLFTAHEVLQMKPLWYRDGAYGKFLKANQWVKKFLPTAWEEKAFSVKRLAYSGKPQTFTLRYFEQILRALQLWYMKNRRSTEVVSNTIIRFHPRDARGWIRSKLAVRLSKYNIPLDKIFYAR